MKQKYLILKNKEKDELIIRESAELDKEAFSLLCAETYPGELIKSAIAKSREALISALRTKNMYPNGIFAAKIAEEVINLYTSQDAESVELVFDDLDILPEGRDKFKVLDDIEGKAVEIDELLEDDDEDASYDDDDIDKITYPIQVADDDSVDTDDDEE